jgi:hypothetical protein
MKLAALFGAGVLALAFFGTALAATGASNQGVTPTLGANINIGLPPEKPGPNKDIADCSADDGIVTGDSAGSDTTTNGVTVTWTYDGTTKAVGFTATGGVVTIAYVKGSAGYNIYDYTGFAGGGVASDGNMFAPDNASGGPAGLSHAVFCTGPSTPEASPSFEQSQADTTDAPSFEQSQADVTQCPCDTTPGLANTSHPADGAWLLVVALGVLLASVVVLTPARAKNRR